MTKQEYINELKRGLRIYPISFQNDILEAFEEHFNAGLVEGQSEEDIMQSLGTVEEVLQNIKEMEETPVTLVNFHEKDSKEKTEPKSDIPLDNLAETITKAVTESLKGLNVSIDDIIRKSINVTKDAVKDVKTTNNNYDSKHNKQRYYDLDEEILDAEDCTSIQINIPIGNCDIEIYSAPTTSYHFENYHNLFSNSTGTIHSLVSDDALLLETHGNHVSGKLVVYASDVVERLLISTKSSDIDITNLQLEELKIQSISSDITIECATCEETIISTTSGDIDLRRVNGSFMISTTSGDVEAMDVQAEQFIVQSTSGDIDFEGSCDDLSIKTIGGDVEVTFHDTVTDARIQTTSGDVDMNIDNEDYTIIIETMSGDVCNHTRMCNYRESHRCIRLGDGDSEDIAITTLSGDITIR